MIGIVISSHLNTYKIRTENNIILAFPMSKLKENKIFIGDKVRVIKKKHSNNEEINLIEEVFPRKNYFLRPRVANIDNAFIVSSTIDPKLSDYYIDKLITIFQFQNVKPILIFTKIDLNYGEEVKKIITEYENLGYQVLLFKKKFENTFLKKLEELVENKFNVLAGNTGVGKTTIVNSLGNDLELKTQEISKFLKRGKHTTTNLRAYEIFEKSFFIDSPGFSIFKTDLDEIDISHNFLTFSKYLKGCKFSNCLHINEAGCNIKDKFSKEKYNNYLKFLEELKK